MRLLWLYTVVQAFVSCRLDYYNFVLPGVADLHLRRLQSLQNAAACLVSGTRCHDHNDATSCFTTLATSSSASCLQDGSACAEVSTWRSSPLLG